MNKESWPYEVYRTTKKYIVESLRSQRSFNMSSDFVRRREVVEILHIEVLATNGHNKITELLVRGA